MPQDGTPVRDDMTAEEVETYQWRALNDIPGCVFVLGGNGTIVYANKAARSIMGLGDFVGKIFAEYFMVCPNSANDRFYDVVLQAVRDHTVQQNERCLFVSPKGTRYAFHVTSSYLDGSDGISYLVVTCTDVTPEERADRVRHESTFMLLAIIVYMCAFLFVYATWEYLGRPFDRSYLTHAIEVGGMVLGFVAFRFTSLRRNDLGLGFANIGRILVVDGLASVGAIGMIALVKLAMMRLAPGLLVHPEALCSLGWVSLQTAALYVYTAIIQEFLARGIMQQTLLAIIRSRHSHTLAAVLSGIMIASLHVAHGPIYMLGAAVLLSLLGVVYDRQKSIWGVALIHCALALGVILFGFF